MIYSIATGVPTEQGEGLGSRSICRTNCVQKGGAFLCSSFSSFPIELPEFLKSTHGSLLMVPMRTVSRR